MRIGAALFLIAVGAILKWAVTDNVNNINLGAVGVILMVVGIVGLVLELIWWSTRRNSTVVTRTTPGTTYVEHPDPIQRY
jgi:hypothetical protein